MDSIDYYNQYATQYYKDTVNLELDDIRNEFIDYLPEDSEIMDLGCGSGRDSLYFMERGFDVTAVDGSKELCELASIHIGQDVLNLNYNELDFSDVFDGVWACASFTHSSRRELVEVLGKIHESLKDGGILFMSFKYGDFDGVRNNKYYKYYHTKEIKDIIDEYNGFTMLKINKANDIRPERFDEKWIHVIAKKE